MPISMLAQHLLCAVVVLLGPVPNDIKQGSTLTFEGTCQVGQVSFNFYRPGKILTYPAKGVIG